MPAAGSVNNIPVSDFSGIGIDDPAPSGKHLHEEIAGRSAGTSIKKGSQNS
jgi:hypothetical protein